MTKAWLVALLLSCVAIGCAETETGDPSPPAKTQAKAPEREPTAVPPLPPVTLPTLSCGHDFAGATQHFDACPALDSKQTFVATNFRSDVVEATSVAPAIMRLFTTYEVAMASCIAEAFVLSYVGRAKGDCSDTFANAAGYTMSNGVYTVAASNQAAFFGHPIASQVARSEVRIFDASGALVTADIGKPDSYLRGMRISIQNGRAVVAYDAPGPLASLLGFGDSPPNPIVLSQTDTNRIGSGIRDLGFEASLHFDLAECSMHTTIEHAVPRTTVGDVLDHGIRPVFVSGGATHDSGAKIAITSWDLAYAPSGIPQGAVAFTVTGDDPIRRGTISFAGTSALQTDLAASCAP